MIIQKGCLRKKVVIICVILAIIAVALGLGLYFGLKDDDVDAKSQSPLGKAAIAANGVECAEIGKSIFNKQGSIADAAVAVLLCEGVTCPQSMGLGGGFVMTMYLRETKTVKTMIAREKAPLLATEDMFNDDPTASYIGGLASGVPGELKGYWELHKEHGKLDWAEIVQPTIDLCRKGHRVSPYLARIMNNNRNTIMNEPTLSEVFVDPNTGAPWVEGDLIKRLKLAETLEAIKIEGADAIYNGSLTDGLIADITSFGGIISKEDLLAYKPRWAEPVTTDLSNKKYKLFTTPLPSSGNLLSFMLKVLDDHIDPKVSVDSFHRIVETFKHAFAQRTQLGDIEYIPSIQPYVDRLSDPEFIAHIRSLINDDETYNDVDYYGANFTMVEDHGTAHISLIGPNGDAISITSTINDIFGNRRRSRSTGIIMNDEMDDFAVPNRDNIFGLPPSPANLIVPGKRPMSSMAPTIIVDENGDVQFVIGGAGGTKISTSVAYTIIRHLWFKENLQEAMNAKRVHHQLMPMEIQCEYDFQPTNLIAGLQKKKHVVRIIPSDSGFAALTGISRNGNTYSSVNDIRRGGSSAVFEVVK